MSFRREGPGVKNIEVGLKELEKVTGKVGWFASATYEDGTSVAYVATIHEFGTMTEDGKDVLPARPFMRPAVADHGQEWMDLMTKGARSVLKGKHTPVQVLEAVMLRAAGDIGKKISELTEPALSESTIARKKSSKLLVDTGQLLQSLTGVVEEEE